MWVHGDIVHFDFGHLIVSLLRRCVVIRRVERPEMLRFSGELSTAHATFLFFAAFFYLPLVYRASIALFGTPSQMIV